MTSKTSTFLAALLPAAAALVLGAGAALAGAQEPVPPQQSSTQQGAIDPLRDADQGDRNSQDAMQDENDEALERDQTQGESVDQPPQRSESERGTMREPEAARSERSRARVTTKEPPSAPHTVTAAVQSKFDALDSDHDGTIDRSEAAASELLLNQFDALDRKGDGKLTIDEFATASDIALIRNEHRDNEQE